MTEQNFNLKNFICVILLFGVLIVSILSPIGSNRFLPSTELKLYTSGVIQAKMAMDQGEFPIRTAPWQQNGWGNAWFQFYSPVPFTLSGAIYKWITPENPYFALKLTLALSMLLGSIYFYHLIYGLVRSKSIAVLSTSVYLFSPYYLLNILSRGDFTEAVAQGFIPIAVYYSLQLYFTHKFNLFFFISTAISWFLLASTHIVTFIYTSLFLALLLLLMTIHQRYSIKQLIFVGLAYAYSILLGFYYFVPIALFSEKLTISQTFDNFPITFWLTSLPALLTPKALSPMPLPGNHLLPPDINLYFSVGLPIILAVGIVIYFINKRHQTENIKISTMVVPLLFLFLISFFATCSPFNFWEHLPKVLRTAQFSYRLLTQIMWMGTLLFAIAMSWIFRDKFDIRHGFVGLLLLVLYASSWINTQKSGDEITTVINNPDLGYGQTAYLIMPLKVHTYNQNIIPVTNTEKSCEKIGKKTFCDITVKEKDYITQLPILYYPKMLTIKVNHQPVRYVSTLFINSKNEPLSLVGLKLEPGHYLIESTFTGLKWSNWLTGLAWVILLILLVYSLKNRKLKI